MHGRTATETKAIKHLYVMNSVHRYMISISNQEPIIILTCIEIAGSFLQFQSTSSSAPVPVYFIQYSISSLPDPVLQFQVFLIQCSSSSLPDPVLRFQSQDPAPCGAVPAYLIKCSSSSLLHPVLQFQSS